MQGKRKTWGGRLVCMLALLTIVGGCCTNALRYRKEGRVAPVRKDELGQGTFTIYQMSPTQPVGWVWVENSLNEYWALHTGQWAFPGMFWPMAFFDIDYEGTNSNKPTGPHDQTLECFVRWIEERWGVPAAQLTIHRHRVSPASPGPMCPNQQHP